MIILIANLLVNVAGLDFEKAKRIARVIAILGVVLLILASIYGWMLFTNWRLQNEIEREREARSQEHQERIEEAKEDVNKSANAANQSLQNVANVENKNFSNTNLSEAERLRCKAFPERCRK